MNNDSWLVDMIDNYFNSNPTYALTAGQLRHDLFERNPSVDFPPGAHRIYNACNELVRVKKLVYLGRGAEQHSAAFCHPSFCRRNRKAA